MHGTVAMSMTHKVKSIRVYQIDERKGQKTNVQANSSIYPLIWCVSLRRRFIWAMSTDRYYYIKLDCSSPCLTEQISLLYNTCKIRTQKWILCNHFQRKFSTDLCKIFYISGKIWIYDILIISSLMFLYSIIKRSYDSPYDVIINLGFTLTCVCIYLFGVLLFSLV